MLYNFIVSWIYKIQRLATVATIISYSTLAPFIPLLFYQPLPFLEKNVLPPIFWKINRTPIPIPIGKWGKSSYD